MEPRDFDATALATSEERLRAFMQHSPVFAFMKDAQFRYVYGNRRLEELFGVSVAQIYGKSDIDWLPAAVARTVRENDRKVLATGQTLEVVEIIPTADGQERQWLVNKFPFTNRAGEKFVGGVGMDVTSLHLAEARLRQSEERYRLLVEHSQGLMCTHDVDGRLLTVNAAALRSLGYEAHELIGRNLGDLLSPRVREQFPRYLERMKLDGDDSGLLEVRTKDGRLRTWQYHNVRIQEPSVAEYVLGHAQDVTDLREAQEQLRTLAVTDELTGLLNRRGFFSRAARVLQKWGTRHTFTLIYADIDELKHINDSFGHDVGSQFIAAAADALKNSFRAADVLGRMGGDEFVVLAQLSPDTVTSIVDRFDEHLLAARTRAGLPRPLMLSIGIASLEPGSPTTLDDLVRMADQNMYEQKRSKARVR